MLGYEGVRQGLASNVAVEGLQLMHMWLPGPCAHFLRYTGDVRGQAWDNLAGSRDGLSRPTALLQATVG